jgi:hypothetical protein
MTFRLMLIDAPRGSPDSQSVAVVPRATSRKPEAGVASNVPVLELT